METGIKEKFYMQGRNRYYPCDRCTSDHPSTTTILDVIGSPALMGWSAKMGTKKLNIFSKYVKMLWDMKSADLEGIEVMSPYEAASKMSEEQWKKEGETSDFWKSGTESAKEAADYGTIAHAAFEMFLQGKEVDLHALPEPSRNAFNVFRIFAEENKIETIGTETTFYNCQMGYAGTADWMGTLNGKLTLSDHKTSTGIFEKNIIQVWANAIADEMMNGKNLYEQVAIWRFGKNGSTDILLAERNGRLILNGKVVQENGYFGSYEQARILIKACIPWFYYKNNWEMCFPYYKKREEKK